MFRNAQNNGLSAALSDAKEQVLEKPRKAKLSKGDNGYGFYLKMDIVRFCDLVHFKVTTLLYYIAYIIIKENIVGDYVWQVAPNFHLH